MKKVRAYGFEIEVADKLSFFCMWLDVTAQNSLKYSKHSISQHRFSIDRVVSRLTASISLYIIVLYFYTTKYRILIVKPSDYQ